MSQLQATILLIETAAEACKKDDHPDVVFMLNAKANDTYITISFGTTPNNINIPADDELYIENNKLIVRKHTIQNSSSNSRKNCETVILVFKGVRFSS